MNFKIYNNVFTVDKINHILQNIKNEGYHQGRVGNRVNLSQKIRKDLFIDDNALIKYIDCLLYTSPSPRD